MPGRPTTSSRYLVRDDLPDSKSCSWTRAMAWADALVSAIFAVVWSVLSEPAMGAVPLQRPADALGQPDPRREPDLRPRARDVERAALREEIDAAAKNRRLDSQRRTHRLADRPGDPERPDRQMACGHGDPCAFRHQSNERVQRGDFPARQNIGAIRGGGMLAKEAKAFHQIVDVSQMVIDFAAAECEPSLPGNTAKEPEQPAIAGAIDAGRPRDGDLDAQARRRVPGETLALELRLLIHITWPQRRLLVGGWMLDVSVHADRAAMNHPSRAAARSRLDH